ncbi:MAG: phytanoyl-CoA dioxygenase family protein [Gammaproteobacteria bacterium]|nr:phytanoyl-CoA dioxygenase family protein [Gammaproteobacteria bacterium]MCP5199560.1 phytanoyl-CoA dioxygenase family protein [Gammaproteobacteria bacterium]
MLLRAHHPEVTTDYGSEQAAMQAYLEQGAARARALGNRGPIRYDAEGEVAADILEAYRRTGFYVFEGVIGAAERADLERDLEAVLERAPAAEGATVDRDGRPALGRDCTAPTFFWSRPLGDPFGGTDIANGRHPAKMYEPRAAADAPDKVMYLFLGSLQFSDACLRLYGHPDLLAVAAAVNGPDFTPFNEGVWIKNPGQGASVAWHQDGVTHWDSPELDGGTHGFNFMAQLYGCTPANGVWVVPGSHEWGKVDIKALVAAAGSDRLPDAVPMVCAPGDVAICNRQAVHGSFANTSRDTRVTINFGFHRRRSVLGVVAGGVHNAVATYTAERIHERSRLIAYAIDARRQRYPHETPHAYAPFAGAEDAYRWSPAVRPTLRDYNLLDLSI